MRNSFNREKCDVLILKWSIWELYSTAWHHFWAQLNNNYEWDGISMQFQVTCQWQFVTDTVRWTCLLLKFSQFVYLKGSSYSSYFLFIRQNPMINWSNLTRTVRVFSLEVGYASSFTAAILVAIQNTLIKCFAVFLSCKHQDCHHLSHLKMKICIENNFKELTLQKQIGFSHPLHPSRQSVWHGQA